MNSSRLVLGCLWDGVPSCECPYFSENYVTTTMMSDEQLIHEPQDRALVRATQVAQSDRAMLCSPTLVVVLQVNTLLRSPTQVNCSVRTRRLNSLSPAGEGNTPPHGHGPPQDAGQQHGNGFTPRQGFTPRTGRRNPLCPDHRAWPLRTRKDLGQNNAYCDGMAAAQDSRTTLQHTTLQSTQNLTAHTWAPQERLAK